MRFLLLLVLASLVAACGPGESSGAACMVCVEHNAANGGCTWMVAEPALADGGCVNTPATN